MDVQLQELIDKIKKDGVASAETSAQKIIADAEKKAAAIISEAQEKADGIIKNASITARRGLLALKKEIVFIFNMHILAAKLRVRDFASKFLQLKTIKYCH